MRYPDSCGLGVTFPLKQSFKISKTINVGVITIKNYSISVW